MQRVPRLPAPRALRTHARPSASSSPACRAAWKTALGRMLQAVVLRDACRTRDARRTLYAACRLRHVGGPQRTSAVHPRRGCSGVPRRRRSESAGRTATNYKMLQANCHRRCSKRTAGTACNAQTHNLCHGHRCLPPLARPVKRRLGPASRGVACHDALLVRVARAAVLCIARRLSQVACCRCADTASAHESTPQQPPAARQYGSTPDGHGTAGG